ncbi:MAG: hypothetical protein SGILL_001839, partial [Bacillariaceae sp.]
SAATTQVAPLFSIPHPNEEEQHFSGRASPDGRREFLLQNLVAFGAIVTAVANPNSARAEDIKTLDLSLPSYGAINTLKMDSDAEKAMGVENPPEEKARGPAPKKKSSSGGGRSGGGGNPMAKVLPSMNKSVTKKSRSSGSTATASERPTKRVKEDKEEDEIKTMDLSLPSYSDTTAGKEKSAFAL